MVGRCVNILIGVAVSAFFLSLSAFAQDEDVAGDDAAQILREPTTLTPSQRAPQQEHSPDKNEFKGSLYPNAANLTPVVTDDMSPEARAAATAILLASASVEDFSDPQLAEALGPAAYILADVASGADFQSAIRQAVGRHPAYHAQLSVLDETRAERRRARAPLYPQISTRLRGDYSLSRDFETNTQNVVESLRPDEQYSASISASQLVFDGGATFQRIKSARAKESEFRNAISTRINDLSLAALAAHHDLATHQALLALGAAIVNRHGQILEDVKERERLGAGSMADVTRAAARLAAARARVAEIRESERLAAIRYLEFFNDEPGRLVRPAFAALSVSTREQAETLAAIHNPEIAAASSRADASQAEYKAAKRGRLPELRVSVDAVRYDIFDGGDDFDVRAGLDLNYNIFGGGARAATIAQAASRARQDKFSEAQVRQSVERDAAIAFEKREGAELRLQALAEAVIAHDKTRDLVLERYRYARGDLIDVLQAENDYFEAAVSYLAGLANRDMSIYGLMEHTGDLLRFFSPADEFAAMADGGVDGE